MNIDYALALQLKNAGFPQKGEGRTMTPFTKKTLDSHSKVEYGEPVYRPTIEQLIEEINKNGGTFSSLRSIGDGMYRAVGFNNEKDVWEASIFKGPLCAMCHLWLALNKK